MYNDDASFFYTDAARKVVEKCDELILYRSRVNDKEDFARLVIQNLFGVDAIDLLSLSPKFDDIHADALNRLNGLIGFESSVFKIIYTNDSLFNDFIRVFVNHAVNSKAVASVVNESIYMWLLLEYLGHILPTDEVKLNLVKNSSWLSASFNPTSAVAGSPRRLLRPEILAASYPLERIAMRTVSLQSLYPRLLQFVGSFIQHLSSLNTWPSIAQCEVLKAILNHYHNFIIIDTDDSDFLSLKLMLVKNPLFTNVLQTFVERLLLNWPLVDSYIRLIELLITLTYHRSFEIRNEQKQQLFLTTSTQHFIGYFELIIERVLDADCITLFRSSVLDFLEQKIFNAESFFPKLFSQFGLVTVNYLELILGKLVRFKNEQKLLFGSDQNSSFLVKVVRFISSFSQFSQIDIEVCEHHINIISGMLKTMQNTNYSFDSGNSNNALVLSLSNTSTSQSPSSFSVNKSDLNSSFSSRRKNWLQYSQTQNMPEKQQKKIDKMPDHEIDRWTKMLFLTPSGRAQVINRQARFDFKQCSKQIAQTFPHVTRWEIAPLVRYLHNLSVKWSNCWLVYYLRKNSRSSTISRKMASVLLCAPSPPPYVPVFSKYVPEHSQRLNLRIFASVPILIGLYALLYLFFVILWRILF